MTHIPKFPGDPEVDLPDTDDVPFEPLELSDHDRENIGRILAGMGDWFSAKVLRLCRKADRGNLERLRLAFPLHVEAYEGYVRGDPPVLTGRSMNVRVVDVAQRLEELRVELRAERMSYGELAELQSLAEYIDPGDVELLEAAGVPEFSDSQDPEKGS